MLEFISQIISNNIETYFEIRFHQDHQYHLSENSSESVFYTIFPASCSPSLIGDQTFMNEAQLPFA